jgi:hypothetical protein
MNDARRWVETFSRELQETDWLGRYMDWTVADAVVDAIGSAAQKADEELRKEDDAGSA